MRKLCASVAVVIAASAIAPTPVSSGGWVVVSLDSVPAVDANEDTTIGFTVLRHGVTPESSDDITLVVTAESGQQERFEVVQRGAVGHHVATIRVPEAGSYSWELRGPFVDYDLGTLEVGGSPGASATWRWDVLQWAGAAVALTMAGLAILELRRARAQSGGTTVTA